MVGRWACRREPSRLSNPDPDRLAASTLSWTGADKIEGEHGPIRVGGPDLGRLQFTREQAVALLFAVLGSKMLDVPELESQNDMLWR